MAQEEKKQFGVPMFKLSGPSDQESGDNRKTAAIHQIFKNTPPSSQSQTMTSDELNGMTRDINGTKKNGDYNTPMQNQQQRASFPQSSKFYHRLQDEQHKNDTIREITRESIQSDDDYITGEDGKENLNQMTFMHSSKHSKEQQQMRQNQRQLKAEPADEIVAMTMSRRNALPQRQKRVPSNIFDESPFDQRGQTFDSDEDAPIESQRDRTGQVTPNLGQTEFRQSSENFLQNKYGAKNDRDRGYTEQSDITDSLMHSSLNDDSALHSSRTSRSSNPGQINRKSKTLTDYTLLMLNFIPATIIQQLCQIDSQYSAQGSQQADSRPSLKHVPSSQIDGEQKLKIPLRCNIHSVVLVAEFTSFYDEVKALQNADNKNYNEHLVTQSSQFLEIISGSLQKFGGDLIQFMGYSLVAIWPGFDETLQGNSRISEGAGHKPKDKHSYIQEVCRKAAQCALDAKREIAKLMGQKIKVIFGLCHGDFQVLHMGGILKRIEFFVSGSAYQQALSVMRATKKRKDKFDDTNDNIAVYPQTWSYIREFFEGEPFNQNARSKTLINKSNDITLDSNSTTMTTPEFYFILSTKTNVKLSKQNYLQKEQIDERKIQRVQIQLKSYIPAAFRHFAHIKDDRLLYAQGSHLKQTVVAMAIELNQESLDCTTKDQLNMLQSIVEIIQMQVYAMEGSINRILTYEGGLIVVASWGTAFLNHDDDAPRAIYAALNIKKELVKFQQDFMVEDDTFIEPPIHIGIATGDIFQGIVGRMERKEVVSIGSAFERCHLLMQTAVKHYGKVYVDQATRMSASHFITFEFVEMLEFSHKILNQTVYQVVNEESSYSMVEFNQINKQKQQDQNSLDKKSKARNQASRIKIHANPFFLDKDNSYQKKFSETYGRIEIIQNICDDIAEYIENQAEKNVWILAIRGIEGSGKSLFARKLLLETSYREKSLLGPLLQKNNQKFHFEYVICNCNSNVSNKFIGMWRPFLRQLLSIYSQHQRQSKEYTINSQIRTSNVDDKVDIIESIFDLKNLARSKSQTSFAMKRNTSSKISIPSQQSFNVMAGNSKNRSRQRMTTQQQGLEGERYEADFEDTVILFCLDFILQALEELQSVCCFFIIFDNVSMMSITSWKLFDLISTQPNLLIMCLCIRTQQKYFEAIDNSKQISSFKFQVEDVQETRDYYQKYIQPRENEIFNIADMAPISRQSFKKAMIDLSPVYERDINNYIEELTKILDTTTSDKSFQDQKKIALTLVNTFQGHNHFKNIHDEVMDQIMLISEGNPLTAFWFTFQAILGKFVKIKDQELIPTNKFRTSKTLNEWTNLDLPWPLFKQNQVTIQKAINENKFAPASTAQMQMSYLLQTAAVIGDNFSMKLLDHVNKRFFNSESQQMFSTMKLLNDLEQRDIIELIYDDNMLNDKFYRFTHPFTRSTIYQSMPWEWKVKDIHQKIIEYMKDNVIYDYTTGWSQQKEFMIMMRHVMSVEKTFIQSKLSNKAKQTLMVKTVNQFLALSKKKSNILSGNCDIQIELKDKIMGVDLDKTRKIYNIMTNLKQNCLEFFEPIATGALAENNGNALQLSGVQEVFFKCVGFLTLDQIMKVKPYESKRENKNQKDAINKKNSFVLKCNKWSTFDDKKKKFSQVGKTEFVLTILQDENWQKQGMREPIEWITAIEYLKAKKTYEQFFDNFDRVNLGVQRINQNQMSTFLQKQEANNVRNISIFGKDFQGKFQRDLYIENQSKQSVYEITAQSDEGASDMPGGSSLRSKRRQTLVAGQHLSSVSTNRMSIAQKSAIQVQALAKKLLLLYNITAVSFYGHMQTCALKDPQLEQENGLGLGKLSAIDMTNITQMSTRKSMTLRKKSLLGQNSAISLQSQIQQLILKHLPKSFTAKTNGMNSQNLMKQQLNFAESESENVSMITSEMDNGSAHVQSPKQSKKVAEYNAFGNEVSISQADRTMTDFNAEKNLYLEERIAVVGRTRTGNFVPGQKVGITHMYLQEKLDGQLGNFKLQRRHDRIGYNHAMSPFIEIGQNVMRTIKSSGKLHQTTPPQLATLKSQQSLRNYNSLNADNSNKNIMMSSSSKMLTQGDQEKANAGISIMNMQNVQKLPQNNRKAKGLAIEKILESTQKPWFMLTGMEYNRPSPFQQQQNEHTSPSVQTSLYNTEKNRKKTQPSHDNLDQQKQQAKKRSIVTEPNFIQHQHHKEHSFNKAEESKLSFKGASSSSKLSSKQSDHRSMKMRDNQHIGLQNIEESESSSHVAMTQRNDRNDDGSNNFINILLSNHQNNTSLPSQIKQDDSGQSSTKSLISLIKDQTLKMQSNRNEKGSVITSSDQQVTSNQGAPVLKQEWNSNSFSENQVQSSQRVSKKQSGKHSSSQQQQSQQQSEENSKSSSKRARDQKAFQEQHINDNSNSQLNGQPQQDVQDYQQEQQEQIELGKATAMAAIVIADKTPFVVLQDDEGRVQLTADQVDFELNANDIIFVQSDLPAQQQGQVIMSKCICYVRNQPVSIILPKQNYQFLNNAQGKPQTQQSWTNLNRITEETQSNYNSRQFNNNQTPVTIQSSPSQTLGFQAERKLIEEDSAERLLMRTPTELGMINHGSQQYHQQPQQQQQQQQYFVQEGQQYMGGPPNQQQYAAAGPQQYQQYQQHRMQQQPSGSASSLNSHQYHQQQNNPHLSQQHHYDQQQMQQTQQYHNVPQHNSGQYGGNNAQAAAAQQTSLKVNQRRKKYQNQDQQQQQFTNNQADNNSVPAAVQNSGGKNPVMSKMEKRRVQRELINEVGFDQYLDTEGAEASTMMMLQAPGTNNSQQSLTSSQGNQAYLQQYSHH